MSTALNFVDRPTSDLDGSRRTALAEAELNLRVDGKVRQSTSVVSLVLKAANDAILPSWEPGAHIDLLLPNGITRQYSLCGDPAQRTSWRVGVLREAESRGGSSYIHDTLKVGDIVRMRGPRNHFWIERRPRYLFIAGGIGITPVLPMIRQAATEGADWSLAYGGRTRASMAFLEELASYGGRVKVYPQAESGVLDLEFLLRDMSDDQGVYCCGPEGLIAAVEGRFNGGQKGDLHVERFKASAVSTSQAAGFDVVLCRSGRTIAVSPNQTILDAFADAGIVVPSSCREGICGTCEVGVLCGRPAHFDQVLSPAEKAAGKTMMVCVSRSLDPTLELDL